MALPVAAAAQGKLDTLPRGTYGCELPGNAAGPAGVPVADAGFKIVNASSYTSPRGSGSYLRTGKTVEFTSGPMRGRKFRVQGRTLLRELDEDGSLGRMRCVLYGR
ncbi:elongation factor P [Altererythrobacter sp. ZODW24]|uniref:elongation factor P n=1 Tax=Altererythrobacter sp. ZODW24 TaxID=2185142 RepID=UPI001F075130|nr:elongation factor P [Altererythrobacter sp. ZODW24]